MKRKKRSGGGGANWMDTYGDMVTLLLCFFVLLYSMSTISEENWKAIVMSFNPDARRVQTETQGGEGPYADPSDIDGSGMGQNEIEPEQAANLAKIEVEKDIEELFQSLKNYVEQEGIQQNISVTKGDGKVYVTFNDAVFFDGDDWTLREESKPILEAVAGMLSDAADSIDEVRILGHTAQGSPERPNDPFTDRLLSAQRAAVSLAYIQVNCTVDPARMVSEGYGQHRPVSENDTSEGRQANRRVEMIVSGRDIDAELEAGLLTYSIETRELVRVEDAEIGEIPAETVNIEASVSENGEETAS